MKKELNKKELNKISGGANLSEFDEFRQQRLNVLHAHYLQMVKMVSGSKVRHPRGSTVEERIEIGLRTIMRDDMFCFTKEEIISGKVIPIIKWE